MAETEVHDLRATAVHEAGHAIALARLFPGSPINVVTIVPDADEGSAGYVQPFDDLSYVSIDTTDEEADNQFFRAATYYCAGYAATIALGWGEAEAIRGCDSDFEAAGHRLHEAMAEALRLMKEPANIAAVNLIADELLGHQALSGDRISILIDVADGNCTREEYDLFVRFAKK